MINKKPNGYWKNKDNIIREARKVIEQNGLDNIPSSQSLMRLGHSSLSMAIIQQFRSFIKFREELGYEGKLDMSRKYTSKSAIEQIAQGIMLNENWKTLPASDTLRQKGYSGFVSALSNKYDGGRKALIKNLGLEDPRISPKFKELEETISEPVEDFLKRMYTENRKSPKFISKFLEDNYDLRISWTSLNNWINILNIPRRNLSDWRSSESNRDSERGVTLKNLEFALEKASQIKKESKLDRLPPYRKLQDMGYGGLATAIVKYHGKFARFRKLLGEDKIMHKSEDLKRPDYVTVLAEEAMEELGTEKLPPFSVLLKNGYSPLLNAIHNHHGGFSNFRKLLGQDQLRRKYGSLKDTEYIFQEIQEIMARERWDDFPSSTKLAESGYSSIVYAIVRYHGGFPVFREKLNGHMNVSSETDRLESLLETYAGVKDE